VDTQEELVPIGQVQSTGQLVTTLQPQVFPVTDGTKPLGSQVSDNVNEFVGLNLNIPIFNRMTVRNQVQNAEISKQIADVNYQQTVNELRQTIYQAHADAKSAYQSLLAARKSENASQKALEYAQERFEVGALNQLDYETARNNYTRARSQLLQARYDFIFRMKVLEFYLTNQVVLQDE
jgi:outer membrane protein